MEGCPNCGVPVRPGAKFCTTCGLRLRDDTGELTATEGVTDASEDAPVFDAVGAMAAADWSAAEARDEATVASAGDAGDRPVGGGVSDLRPVASHTDELDDAAWRPPQDATATVAADGDGRLTMPSGAEADDATPNRDGTPAWSVGVAGSATDVFDDEVPSVGEEDEASTVASGWDEAPSPVAGYDATVEAIFPGSGTDGDHDAATAAASMSDHEETPMPSDRAPFDTDDPTTGGTDPFETGAAAWAMPGGATDPATEAAGADGVERARSLVARASDLLGELQRLLPSMEAAATPVSAYDPEAIAEELEEALRATSEGVDIASLEAVLVTARDQPRDIDAMLQLTARRDDLIALYEGYQRSTAAITAAVSALRGTEPTG